MQYKFQVVLQHPVLVLSLSHQRKRGKKKESGDSFVNFYLRLGLTCLLLSAICCCRLCLLRVLLDSCSFCFLYYTALPAFCNCSLFLKFIYSSCGECPSPTFWCSFPQDSHCYKLSPLQGCWSGAAAPAFSCQLVYLQFM
jgi:hypothetical protein